MKFDKLSRKFSKICFTIKKKSPEIMVVGGTIGTVIGTVMACKATTKASDILETHKDSMNKIHTAKESGKVTMPDGEIVEYTKKDVAAETTHVYLSTSAKCAKLYAPSAIVMTVSVGSILTGHNILKKRHVALAAAYKAVDTGFKSYRENVVEKYGKEVDREMRYGIKKDDVEVITMDEKGNETKDIATIETIDKDPSKYSDYARFFDSTCYGFKKDPEYNLTYLRAIEAQATDKLQRKGHLFLNEVYKMIGLPMTKAGQTVGWIYNEENPVGDNYVDLGIFRMDSDASRRFVNGYEPVILIDPNVDGYILDDVKFEA